MPTLRAIRVPPERFGDALRRAWDAGEAAVPLPLDARAGVVDDRFARLAARGGAVDAAGAALVIATSGSTGRPRGVVLGHAALDASTRASITRLGCRPGERWLLALPLHHVAGIQVLLRAWMLGAEPVVVDAGRTDAIAAADAQHVSLVPTQLVRLIDAGVDLGHFRTILLGGGRADRSLLERAARAGGRVVTSYGMTETGGGCVYDGVALDGVEVRVRDDGRIQVRGRVLFSGYLDSDGRVDLPVDDGGWFTTGDSGRIVGERLEVQGRADDVIVSGGENVALEAVAAALRDHPGLADAAAAGRPDRTWGQIVVAVVVPTDPASPPDLDELRRHVAATHPSVYAPKALVVVDALPHDAVGKLSRASLDSLAAGREAPRA